MSEAIQTEAIQIHGGALVNGVQTDTQVIMARKGYDKWPSALRGLNQWEEKVRAMDLTDVKLPLKNLVMNSKTGGLFNTLKDANAALPATKTAIGHILSYVNDKPSNALGNLLDMPTAIRSQMFTEYMARPAARDVVLRTAVTDSHRVVRAAVSEVHSQEKGDDLAVIAYLKDLANTMPDSKMRVIRQWDNTHAEIIFPNIGVQPKVGVMLYARIQIRNSETKGGAFECLAGSMNLVCLNGMTRPGNESTYRVRHMGDISYRVKQSIKGAIEGVNYHLKTFSDAYSTDLGRPRADIISAFGKAHALPESTGTALAALWDVDGERSAGDTLAGLVNAVTRYAQSRPVEEAATLEALAGEQLHKGLVGLI